MEIILASTNEGKIREIREIMSDLPVTISSLRDFPDIPEIIEDGETFEENALIKGNAIYNLFHKAVLADDSGLVIPALNGEPGVRSARYGSIGDEKPSPGQLIGRVLEKMKDIDISNRSAYFKAVTVLIIDENTQIITTGECYGEIGLNPSGSGGFGYDPIFYLPEYQKTMAEISPGEKNEISHRGLALKKLKLELEHFLQK